MTSAEKTKEERLPLTHSFRSLHPADPAMGLSWEEGANHHHGRKGTVTEETAHITVARKQRERGREWGQSPSVQDMPS